MGAPDDPSTEILPVGEPVEVTPAPSLIGRSLGKFTVIEKLGRGGSGEVFRAEQAQLGRSAVIKVLRHEVANAPNRVERFLREAKLASRLDHPYAAHVYAFGAEPDGVLWIAMEHVRGQTLDELVARRGAMPASVFGPLFARLCEVVHTAHELGIVHRDIKGANVMVIERAGQLLPKLLDFGIAKGDALATTTPGTDELTGHGVTLGSPHYMSPEQWEAAAEVDARADIYALGVLAYRCISGALPFHAESRLELVEMHRKQAPPPLPDFVPAVMAEAIVRALAKQPDERWPTAIGFGDAIRRGASVAAPEAVPIFDPGVRQAWMTGGPQPIADAIARLTAAATTVEADAALRELVAITCRWLAVVALSGLTKIEPSVRERARAVLGRDDGTPWLELARAAVLASTLPLPGLAAAIAGAEPLAKLADRLDDRDRQRTAAALAADVEAAAEALRPLEPLLAYQLVVGGGGAAAESWQGPRRRDRDKVLVWGDPLSDGEVALLDGSGKVVVRLSPLAQVIAPLPSSEPELFLLWRSGRGAARLVAAPWGFERDDDAAGQRLAALSTEDSDTQHDAAGDRSPYPGLAAYRETDAEHFVGREREVEALTNRLVRAPMLACLGPSGVGKSSFIHAGVVPRLGEQHRILTMRPGRHPMHVLASLPPVSSDSQDESALVSRLRELGESAQRGLVIVVDQLEELVTLCADPEERQRFAETLAAAADGPGAPVRVVATLRDDFATVIESQDAFRGRFEVFVLATPPPDALRRIVVEPARRAAVSVDNQVVDDMVAEVAGRPASLPLLSFTASQLWAARDKQGHRISHDSYLALGGVAGALATYADHIYASLARRDQDTVRDLFARLVAADGTRIPSPRKELEELPGARGVLAHLIDARLLVVRDDDGPKGGGGPDGSAGEEGGSPPGEGVIEIVHECLAERWPRLARWRSEDAADRALLGDVRAAARRWLDAGRRPDLLWRGEALAELTRLAARSTALTGAERAFADAARAAALRARRVRRGIVAAAMVALAAVAGVMAYLSIQANDSRRQAESSATKAHEARTLAEDRLTQSLIAQGRRELADNRELNALAYFRAALERGADTRALREMISIANRGRAAELNVATGRGVSSLIASPGGWFATGDETGTVRWFEADGTPDGELATGQPFVAELRLTSDGGLAACAADSVLLVDAHHHITHTVHTKAQPWIALVGPDPDAITTVDRDGFHVYGLDGTLRRTMPGPPEGTDGPAVIAPDARHAAWKMGSTITVADLTAGTSRTLTTEARNEIAASPDGSVFAYVDKTDHVHLVDTTGHEVRVVKPEIHAVVVAVGAAGDRFAAAAQREVEVFDRDGKSLVSFSIPPEQYAFEMSGDDVWTAGTEGTIHHYQHGMLVADRPTHITPVRILLLAGTTLASLAEDSSLVFAKADERQLVMSPEVCPHPSFGPLDLLTTYICGDQLHVYNGRELLADLPPDRDLMSGQYDPASQRTLIYDQDGLTIFGRERKVIAKLPIPHDQHLGAPAWLDGDRVLLGEEGKAVWRWTISTNKLEKLLDVPQLYAQVPIADGLIVGTGDNKVMKIVDGKVVHSSDVHDRVEHLSLSPDRKWALAQLTNGAVAIVDTATGEVTRELGPAEQSGGDPIFDTTGDLILREARNELTIWDRASGDELVFNFRLLDGLMGGRFLPDGRIEVAARSPALLDIPLDNRPTSEIIREIACRVPLEVKAGRLGPSTPKCD